MIFLLSLVNDAMPLPVLLDEAAAFLLDTQSPATAETLRAAGLAAYAYVALSANDPRRESLRPDYLRALRRHHEIRIELAGLVRAWHEAGIEVMLYKGFHLSELVYPSPGMRFHGDVDIVVRPEHASAAVAVAAASGWDQTFEQPRSGHEVCGLFGPSATKIDLHRYALHRQMPWERAQVRLTRAMWAGAQRIEWEGTPVRVPAPVDALLIGVVLQRLWHERGFIKPHDPIDTRLLLEAVTRDELTGRAQELRCERTLAHFLDRCDPAGGRVKLVPSAADRYRLGLIMLLERGLLSGRTLSRLVRAPGLALDVARVLPELVVVRHRLRAQPDLRKMFLEATPPSPRTRSPADQRFRTVRAIRWGTRLLRLNPNGDCLLRSVAIYTALRRQGWPVAFVSGVRRAGGRVQGHAWVEHQGRVLDELSEPANRQLYKETFRWPASSGSG